MPVHGQILFVDLVSASATPSHDSFSSSHPFRKTVPQTCSFPTSHSQFRTSQVETALILVDSSPGGHFSLPAHVVNGSSLLLQLD